MSGPFSNTHLRIPRGFGTILNGLVREVLRDQPEDIPKYAAQYFSSLLKQREESGMDPAEWAAGLEDRFYNNRFKDTEAPATRGMSATKTTTYKGKSNESKTGEESCHSREVSSFSTIQQDASEGSDLTGGTKEQQEEKHDMTENFTPKDKFSKGESVNRELDADEPSGPVEQDPLRNLDSDNEKAIDRVDVDHPDSEFTGISSFSDDVACVSPPTAAEDDGSEKEGVLDKNIVDLNEKTEDEEQAEDFPHSGCPGVNVFEAKIEEKDNAMKGSAATGDRQEERDEKPQHKDTSLPLSESLKSEYERPEDNQRQAEDQAETTEELERLQTCSGETHDRFSNIEDSNTHKADLSVEVSFEGLPEAQEIKEFEDRQPEEQDAVEVLQTNREMLPVEESKETASVAPDQNVSVTQDCEHEVVGVELEANSEGKEVKSQQEASVMKERVDTNDPNLSDEKDKMGEGGKVVSSSYQLTGTPEGDNPEYENSHVHESSLKISKGKSQQKDPNSEAAETTDVQNGDERVSKQGSCKGGAENQSPQASQSNSSTGAPEPETETLETSVHHLSEEDNGGQGTALKAEPEATVLEEGPPEPLELVEEQTYDSETQEDSRTSVKDSVSPDPPADEGEKGHSEKDTAGPEDSSGEKQEDCSRPQEEEDIMDIPLDDPEANRAAAKIQAGFRGHMTRKKLKPEDKAEGEERQEDRGQ